MAETSKSLLGRLMLNRIAVTGLLAGLASVAFANTISFTNIDYPAATETAAFGINDSGQIVGTYNDAPAGTCAPTDAVNCGNLGFLYSAGTFTTLSDPLGAEGTLAYGINNSGKIVGSYFDSTGTDHTYLYSGGTFTTVGPANTSAFGINDSGQIAGTTADSNGFHGFLYSGGTFTVIDDPSANAGSTFGTGVTATGEVVGDFFGASGMAQGFIDNGGIFTTFDDPLGTHGTSVSGTNAAGQIVGSYIDAQGNVHQYVYSGGIFTTIDTPSSSFGVLGINDLGQIVGKYTDASGNTDGFESPSPEPGTLALLAGGLFFLALGLRPKRPRRRGDK
jgi:probable HAF family extracellular repeat protein